MTGKPRKVSKAAYGRALVILGLTMLVAGVSLGPASANRINKAKASSTATGIAEPYLTPAGALNEDCAEGTVRPRLKTLFTPFEPTPAGAYFENEFSPDTVVDKSNPGDMPAPIQNFEGGNNVCPCFPPDTNGDVGPNHYMQWNNVQFRIWNKTGTPLVGPIDGNELFQPGTPCGDNNDGDPIILYDSYSGRWNGSQFAAPNGTSTGPFYQCIAISTTSDPTGTWCSYNFQVHATKFNDYPKMAVWPAQNAYMMTAPQFPTAGGNGGQGLWGFERTPMLACQPARMVYQDMFTVDPNLPRILAADADGATPPPAGAPAPIVGMNFDGSGNPARPAPGLQRDHQLGASDADDRGRQGRRPPGRTVRLEPLQLHPPVHPAAGHGLRSWTRCPTASCTGSSTGTSGPGSPWSSTTRSTWMEHDHAGVRWYELQKQAAVWTIQQQGTYAPDALHRWMGSVAQDKSGDIAVGYSVSAAAVHVPGHSLRRPSQHGSAGHACPGRGDADQRLRLADGHQEPLGRLLDDGGRPRRRLHLLVHDRVLPNDEPDRLADADRLVQVPGVRPRSGPAASASAASSAASATTTAARAPEQRLRQRSRHLG